MVESVPRPTNPKELSFSTQAVRTMNDHKELAKALKQPDPLGPGVTLTKYDPMNPLHKRMMGGVMWDKMFPSLSAGTKKVGE